MTAARRSRLGVFALVAVLALLAAGPLFCAEEKLPPAPTSHFNDYAGVVAPATAQRLDDRLRQFESETSNQILVVVFRKLETDSSIADYTFRIAQSWRVGQKGKDNGAVLFVFSESRKMFIQVGYGLEGALPDATCKRIVADEIAPQFKAGNYDAGLTAGVEAMIKATRGEYKGTGGAAGNRGKTRPNTGAFFLIGIIIALFAISRVFSALSGNRSGTVFGGGSRRSGCGWMMLPMLLGNMGGGRSSWGSSGGGGGGFSGGGGSFGGGGAGGDW